MLAAAVEHAGERTALIANSRIRGGEAKLSYRELSDAARRLAAILAERGVRRGDRMAILMGNDTAMEAHVAYHASHHLGAINVPINTFYVEREFEYGAARGDDRQRARGRGARPAPGTVRSAPGAGATRRGR